MMAHCPPRGYHMSKVGASQPVVENNRQNELNWSSREQPIDFSYLKPNRRIPQFDLFSLITRKTCFNISLCSCQWDDLPSSQKMIWLVCQQYQRKINYINSQLFGWLWLHLSTSGFKRESLLFWSSSASSLLLNLTKDIRFGKGESKKLQQSLKSVLSQLKSK